MATTGGALKAYIEGLGLGLSAYGRRAPEGEALPYVTIQDDVSTVPDALEDGQAGTGVEAVQVDLWEAVGAEDDQRRDALTAALTGAQLSSLGTPPSKRVYTTILRHRQRVPDEAAGRVRHIFDVDLVRQL